MAHVPRLYLPGKWGPGPLVLDEAQAHRLANVMRLRPGDPFVVFAGDGREWRATVTAAGRPGLHAEVHELSRHEPLPALSVELWCALVRPQRFDWAVEKAVEAGAEVIRPLISEHSARGEGASKARRERWERIVVEAAEQSGRLFLPVVQPAARLPELLAVERGPYVLADRDGRTWEAARALLPERGRVAVIVGPEGGLSADEVQKAQARGAIAVSLGPHILRTETAAVVATALARSLG